MKSTAFFFILCTILFQNAFCQRDSAKFTFKKAPHTDSVNVELNPNRFKTKLLPSLIVPGLLIGYGLTTLQNHGLYSSYQARTDIQRSLGKLGSPIDNYLIYAPYVEFGMLLLLKIQCKNDLVNAALLIAKSEVLMLAITFPLKYIVREERPYSYNDGLHGIPLSQRQGNSNAFVSMPSGHTAEAFVAATIVYREFRHKSAWYGVGAYAIATSVGLYRMINDQHWESDVLVGAGIGMLSANIVYATHKHKWGKNVVCFAPTYNSYSKGVVLVCKF